MRIRFRFSALVCLITAVSVIAVLAVTLTPFVVFPSLGQPGYLNLPVGIDFNPVTSRMIVSVNWPSGSPYALASFDPYGPPDTDPNDTNEGFTPFAPKLRLLPDEIKLATVPCASCFTLGDVFMGVGGPEYPAWREGLIGRASANGEDVEIPWLTLPNGAGKDSPGFVRGLHFDRTGVYGGDLIVVTTKGKVFRINCQKKVTRLASIQVPNHIELEGVLTIPNDVEKYGPWAGKILAGLGHGQQPVPECGLVTFDASVPDGNPTVWPLGICGEDMDIIPANADLFSVDTAIRTVNKTDKSEFAGMVGDILITQERPAALIRVRWNGATFETTGLAEGNQFEHVAFAGGAECAPSISSTLTKTPKKAM